MVGVSVGRASFYLYELVGECVHLYVGRGRDGRGKVSWTNDDRGKYVVPCPCPYKLTKNVSKINQNCEDNCHSDL